MKKTIHKLLNSTVLTVLIAVLAMFVITACPDDSGGNGDGNGGDTMYDYVCANGTPVTDSKSDTANTTRCVSCNSGYMLENETCKQQYDYVCANGTKADGQTTTENTNKCTACQGGYYLDSTDEACKAGDAYVCDNGTPADDEAPNATTTKCTECDSGYFLDTDEACKAGDAYVCDNGTPADDEAPVANTNKCKSCDDGYSLDAQNACVQSQPFVCDNGTPAEGGSAVANTTKCASCDTGYHIVDDACQINRYICTNGTPVTATDSDKPDADEQTQKCDSCNTGYHIVDDACQINRYICTNGTPVTATDSDKPNNNETTEKCLECENGYFVNTEAVCQQGISYVCANGVPASGQALAANTTKCTQCDLGYNLVNEECSLSLVGLWQFDTDNTCGTNSCFVSLADDGTVSWHGTCPADATPYAPSHTTAFSVDTINTADGTMPIGIVFDTPGPLHDYTVDPDGTVFKLNPHSTSFTNTNRYLCPHSGLSPLEATTIDLTSATITVTPSHNGTIYWVVYGDGAPAPNAQTLINDATNDGGEANSGASGIPATANNPVQINVTNLEVLTNYDIFVVLSFDADGIAQQVIADKFDFTTDGHPFICTNGSAVEGKSNVAQDEECLECKTGHYKHGDGSCQPYGTIHEGYGVLANGITIVCPDIDVSGTLTINDVTYTKRTKEQIRDNRSEASTTCTTGIEDMSNLFSFEGSFNQDITHWDVSAVTNMSQMFSQSGFNQPIGVWQTDKLENITGMFLNNHKFNQDLHLWNTDNLTGMSTAFQNATAFNGNISTWNVSGVTNMTSLFADARKFNGDISEWDTNKVEIMTYMFRGASVFDGNIGGWDVQKVTNIESMFNDATSFSQDISGWCVSHLSTPTNFATNTPAWMTDQHPQWGDVSANGCPLSITTQPSATADSITADAATITLTATKPATLYWILYDDNTTLANSATLKTAIGNGDGVQRSANPSTLAVGDDTPFDINLTSLIGTTTYRLYAALEITDDDNAIVESVISQVATFTTTNPCGPYQKHDNNNNCSDTVYVCTNGFIDSEVVGETPADNMESNTTSDVEKCGMCKQNFGVVNDRCVPVQTFTVADNGVTILCESFSNGTRGIINGDTTVVYTKRTNKNDITSTNAATTCTTGMNNMDNLFNVSANPLLAGAANFNGDISHWDVSSVTDMDEMFKGAAMFNQNIGDWNVGMVNSMQSMFEGATVFNQDIRAWDVQMVTNMNGIFKYSALNVDLSEWCTGNVTTSLNSFQLNSNFGATNSPAFNGKFTGNNCPVNFTNQPIISGGGANTINTMVFVKPSKDATLYYALYRMDPATTPTLAVLKAAVAGTDNVVIASANTGIALMDDTGHTESLQNLTPGTYHFYAVLESGEESEVSEPLSFTVPSN